MPPILRNGSTAAPSAMMPSPPTHCSIDRHRRMSRGFESSDDITVAPVVVTPDTVSKMASALLETVCEKMKGSPPNMETRIHAIAVSRKTSRTQSRLGVRPLVRIRSIAVAAVIASLMKNGTTSSDCR